MTFCFNRIARFYGGTEFYIVKPRIYRQLSLAHHILHQHAGGLSQYLTENDAGNDGIAGKMTFKEKLITAHGIMPDGSAVLIFRIVQKQHIVSVRQYRHYLFSVHSLPPDTE